MHGSTASRHHTGVSLTLLTPQEPHGRALPPDNPCQHPATRPPTPKRKRRVTNCPFTPYYRLSHSPATTSSTTLQATDFIAKIQTLNFCERARLLLRDATCSSSGFQSRYHALTKLTQRETIGRKPLILAKKTLCHRHSSIYAQNSSFSMFVN